MLLTWIGRIAFPLYAFLLAEGCRYVFRDRERLTRHLVTLLILAVAAEPGYDLMDAHLNFAEYLSSQSNMITLLLGYLGMMATEALLPSVPPERRDVSRIRVAARACAYGLLGFANYMMHGNFNLVGPWLIVAYYWYLRKSNDSAATALHGSAGSTPRSIRRTCMCWASFASCWGGRDAHAPIDIPP